MIFMSMGDNQALRVILFEDFEVWNDVIDAKTILIWEKNTTTNNDSLCPETRVIFEPI